MHYIGIGFLLAIGAGLGALTFWGALHVAIRLWGWGWPRAKNFTAAQYTCLIFAVALFIAGLHLLHVDHY